MSRPPAGYIAPSGDVMVPPELARLLYESRGGLRGFRQSIASQSEPARPDMLALLEAIRYAGARWAGVDSGTPPPEPVPADREWLTSKEAAMVIGISDGGVRKACREHRLAADASTGQWLIHREAIAHFRAARENR